MMIGLLVSGYASKPSGSDGEVVGRSTNKLPCEKRVNPKLLPKGFLATSAVPADNRFCVYLHDQIHDSWLSKTISEKGRLHAAEEDFISSAIESALTEGKPPDSTTGCAVHVLDIGGNIGWMTLFAASLSPHVCVTVVEPFTWHNTLLRASVDLNGLSRRVHLVRALVGETPGPDLCMVADPSNGASTEVRAAYDAERCKQEGGLMTPSTTIDEVLAKSPFGKKVDVMKMDVEGFEALALAGAKEMLADPPRHVCMEWIGWRIERQSHGRDPVAWLNATFPARNWRRAIANGPADAAEVNAWIDKWREPQSHFAKGGDLLLTRKAA